jgi:hypothetical protein
MVLKPGLRLWYIRETALDCTQPQGRRGHDGGVADFQDRGFVPDLSELDAATAEPRPRRHRD